MADDPKPAEVMNLKEKIDVIKIRIEELDRNFFSLRGVEWQMALQFLFGIVAVGLGYHALLSKSVPNPLLTWASVVLVVALLVIHAVFRYLLGLRLQTVRVVKNKYADILHTLVEGTRVDGETERFEGLRGKHLYAGLTQFFVQLLAVATVVTYVAYTQMQAASPPPTEPTPATTPATTPVTTPAPSTGKG